MKMNASTVTILGFVVASAAFCARGSGQQVSSISGVVHKPGGIPVSHAEVRIEGGGAALTTDSGEFGLLMTANLHVGMAAVFHVKNWVILKPCELKNGRTYLRDPRAEPIEFLVLALGDTRLKSAKASLSIIGCLLEEEASQFSEKPKPGGGPRSSLLNEQLPISEGRVENESRGADEKPYSGARGYLRKAEYHPLAFQHPSVPNEAAEATSEELLARRAKELGFSVEELKSAIDVWAKTVEDPYEKGLAALHELRYAEASRYISASIPSPPGAFIRRYVALGRAEYELGHYAGAEVDLRKVLAIHSDDPIVLNNLAVVLDAQAKYSEAEQLYKRALAIDEQTLGPKHPSVATDLNNLGAAFDFSGKYKEAESLLKRALAIDEKALGPNHPAVAIGLDNLGSLYDQQGRYREAEPLLKRALAIDEKAMGPNHPRVAWDLNDLGWLYSEQRQYNLAEPLLKRALAIDEQTLGPNHPTVARRLDSLGSLYSMQGRYNEAEPLYKRALAIDEKALGTDHPELATSLNNLGVLYYKQGRYSEAEPLYKRALAIREKAFGTEHVYVARTAERLAATLHKLGRSSEATAYDQQAAKIRAKLKAADPGQKLDRRRLPPRN
jgi:tetratricopeptide (TPR) repeat protein